MLLLKNISVRYFNSHPHEEDDCGYVATCKLFSYFNSHPHEEDDIGAKVHMKESMYFNSHPHEEDDTTETKC